MYISLSTYEYMYTFSYLISGHVDAGESEFDTAIRETQEESGLTANQMEVHSEFSKSLFYEVKGRPKKTIYWLSRLINPDDEIKLSFEHTDFKWLNFEEACKYAHYPDMVELLKEAHKFIQKDVTN